MSDLGDRLMLLLIAATGIGGMLFGLLATYVHARTPPEWRLPVYALMGVVFLAIIVGIWTQIRPGSDS